MHIGLNESETMKTKRNKKGKCMMSIPQKKKKSPVSSNSKRAGCNANINSPAADRTGAFLYKKGGPALRNSINSVLIRLQSKVLVEVLIRGATSYLTVSP